MGKTEYRTKAQILRLQHHIRAYDGEMFRDVVRHKVEMINLVLGGLAPSYLSTYCGESKRTITLWVKIADEQGFERLQPKKPTGRPPWLTKEQKAEIRAILEEDDPKKYGQNVWDGPSLSSFIEKTICNQIMRSPMSKTAPQFALFPGSSSNISQQRGAKRTGAHGI